MKVLAIIADKKMAGAVEIYRITLPYTYLNKNDGDMRCGWMPTQTAATHLQAGNLEKVFGNDVIVLHRKLSDQPDAGEVVPALRVRGAKVVYEADDDYSGNYRDACEVPGRNWKPYIGLVDALTATTEPLAKLMREESRGSPVYVLPNAIDYHWFTGIAQATERRYPDYLTVMLAGTKTHQADWAVLQDVIPGILADHPTVKFLAGGFLPDYLMEQNIEFLPMVHYTQYPAMLAQADILCAPLDPDDQFNNSKSNIKVVEGWCAARRLGRTRQGGCAVVATKCAAYRSTIQNRHNGILVEHTPEAWDGALRKLIEDRVLRQKLQATGLKESKRYDIAHKWKVWRKVYKSIRGGT